MTPTETAHAIMGPMAEKAFKRAERLTVDEAQKLMCLLGTYKLALETMALANTATPATPELRRQLAYEATNEALLQAEAKLIEMGQASLVGERRGIHVVN